MYWKSCREQVIYNPFCWVNLRSQNFGTTSITSTWHPMLTVLFSGWWFVVQAASARWTPGPGEDKGDFGHVGHVFPHVESYSRVSVWCKKKCDVSCFQLLFFLFWCFVLSRCFCGGADRHGKLSWVLRRLLSWSLPENRRWHDKRNLWWDKTREFCRPYL